MLERAKREGIAVSSLTGQTDVLAEVKSLAGELRVLDKALDKLADAILAQRS